MLNKIGKYINEICCTIFGFYLMAVVLSFAESNNLSIAVVLNSIGIFLSSIGIVVAILTIIQQQYQSKQKVKNEEVALANVLQYNLTFMLKVYGLVKVETQSCNRSDNMPQLLDGEAVDFLANLDFDKFIFISELDPDIYGQVHLALIDYRRYINGVFIWQANQSIHTKEQNVDYLNQRIGQLEEFGSSLIKLQSKLFELLKKRYPSESFYINDASGTFFSNLTRHTT